MCWTRELDRAAKNLEKALKHLKEARVKVISHYQKMNNKFVYQKWVHAEQRCRFLEELLLLSLAEATALSDTAGIRRKSVSLRKYQGKLQRSPYIYSR